MTKAGLQWRVTSPGWRRESEKISSRPSNSAQGRSYPAGMRVILNDADAQQNDFSGNTPDQSAMDLMA
jgi:hypothetical protein